MKITKDLMIKDIQKKFHQTYNGLKLEFYKKSHEAHTASPKESQWPENTLLSVVNPDLIDGTLKLNSDLTVSDFEQMMEKDFGLHVQVFRRSNQLWLQTSATDDWTLEVQNTKGLHSIQK
ncbi:MAG: hypothetical protein H6572_01150 [Lewinellaceae bacterium]|nr:hypothetical protein [Lewinellaceae bacterium]